MAVQITIFILKFISTLSLVIILFSPFSISKLSGNRSFKKAYYGSPCNSSVKCDIHSLLMCEENICQCFYPDAMTYNAELGTCVSLVNEICGYLETKRVFINCISNAFCDQQQGVCKCSQSYVEGDRHCLKQKSYGEPCHSDNECLSELSLSCFEETCQCDPQRYVPFYTANSNNNENTNLSHSFVTTNKPVTKCVARAGLPCTAKTGCVTKASCMSETGNDRLVDSSSVFNWLHPGICQCDEGYEMDDMGHCRGKYGSFCDVIANISCVEHFKCLDSTCHCKYPDDQVYNPIYNQCISLVGGPCFSPNSIIQSGTSDGTEIFSCDKFMECRNSTCTCNNGFVENLDGGCDLSYGQLCTGMGKCDKAVGLHCVDGRCACKDSRREFDVLEGRCIGKTGAACKVTPLSATISSSSSSTGSNSNGKGKRKQGIVKTSSDGEHSCSGNTKCQVSRSHLEGLTTRGFCVPSEGGTGVVEEQSALNSEHYLQTQDEDYE